MKWAQIFIKWAKHKTRNKRRQLQFGGGPQSRSVLRKVKLPLLASVMRLSQHVTKPSVSIRANNRRQITRPAMLDDLLSQNYESIAKFALFACFDDNHNWNQSNDIWLCHYFCHHWCIDINFWWELINVRIVLYPHWKIIEQHCQSNFTEINLSEIFSCKQSQ